MSMNFATDVNVNNGQQIKTNKISAPTSSGGSTYSNGSSGQVLKSNGTNVYWANDNNDNNAVTQTASTNNSAYELLFSSTADNTTRTEGARKTSTLTYNPSTKALSTGGTVNGYTLAAACSKAVIDRTTSTGASSSGTSLITERTLYYAMENAGCRTAITNAQIDALFT